MSNVRQAANKLIGETSPYLLQHAYNPVEWFPWGKEAFVKARMEDKPVFLSIGYSTCHWCHVMAHESFENAEVAKFLNENFISIKVDKEERPDIDSIYMRVCQAMTGSGGWPMSVFLTPDQKPFYAGTYFPPRAFLSVLKQISRLWQTDRDAVIASGNQIVDMCRDTVQKDGEASSALLDEAAAQLESTFDKTYGGFGSAPKFPMPHNLLFLLDRYEKTQSAKALVMAEHTLLRMYMGGLFDHVGYGFSRYSTDRFFLAPHFEKMLYDNALLILAYIQAYTVTEKEIYKQIAEKTAQYILREMTGEAGGFYAAQDADSGGEEGRFYLFDFDEVIGLLGEDNGRLFCEYYGISPEGNFEGKNILNLLQNIVFSDGFEKFLPTLYQYRKTRMPLHLDDKILTAWNGLMIAAFAKLYKILKEKKYLQAAQNACACIDNFLSDGDGLYASFRDGKRGSKGFLDDYAFYIYGLIELYGACYQQEYLDRALALCRTAIEAFYDEAHGGFYLYGKQNEQLILQPKETYDGALPSGNSVMAYNLVLLSQLMEDRKLEMIAKKHMGFMAAQVQDYPMAHCFFLLAVSMHLNPPTHIVCARQGGCAEFPPEAIVRIIDGGSAEYPVLNGKTTYYVCQDKKCYPAAHDLSAVL